MSAPVALFADLFDDAALFPPGDATMAVAVPAHRRLTVQFDGLVGPFVLPAGRLDECFAHLDDPVPLQLSLIADVATLPDALAKVSTNERVTLCSVEVPGVTDGPSAAQAAGVLGRLLPPGLPASVELPRTAARDEVLDVLAGTGHRAKLRTGGVRAELFPTGSELADTLAACTRRGVAFKCTAGLHHAVRYTDPATGLAHQGFLNVLLAVDALVCGGAAPDAVALLDQPDGDALAADLGTWSSGRALRVRSAFTSFGTCSVAEPVADLDLLGLRSAVQVST